MSYFDYEQSKKIAFEGYSFHAIIMAALRAADTDNLELLKKAFPKTYDELMYRYNAPGGVHPMDGESAQLILQLTDEDLDLEGDD